MGSVGGVGVELASRLGRHCDTVRHELTPEADDKVLPSRVHAVVLVSTVHKFTLSALAFARASHPDSLTAVTVDIDAADTRTLHQQTTDPSTAGRRRLPVP
jgi:hypothetical protein